MMRLNALYDVKKGNAVSVTFVGIDYVGDIRRAHSVLAGTLARAVVAGEDERGKYAPKVLVTKAGKPLRAT